jgi:hypothetical protein
VLLDIAVLVKLCGQSQIHALAGWVHERTAELASLFGLKRVCMPHPTTWTRLLDHAVAAEEIEAALQPLLITPSAKVPAHASHQSALDGKTLRGTIPPRAAAGYTWSQPIRLTSGCRSFRSRCVPKPTNWWYPRSSSHSSTCRAC